ncbi:uncharacterized protein Z519_09010 [Cladophialophora bantiana CBS 173.52]|uniref:Transcription factor TFIIIB component B'' Myb domain-containing protein n=1 Tax=Cladophialophora bantiana (strain ATCC 10958 / CBS 173.52 / CDC B-1940 / NIH 8579) TaxID=1442370 RepID=A0A0D2HHU2_CLAB1|nr:uncharacterized protein Z519_09010 [Cladophialophora bantiana CBS 173.52]KIW90365.1 hypothetical protein Z519_09010 [Cladophialophora bantiana CBS 173.52]
MSTFSSVVRKPGQKIVPKGPRRNVQRNALRHAAPPSLTPESQTVSPAVEPADEPVQSQEPESQLETVQIVQVSNEIHSIAPSIETAGEALDTPHPNEEAATERALSTSVEIIFPSRTGRAIEIIHPAGASESRPEQGAIPAISVSTPSILQKRNATYDPTPEESEDSTQERENPDASRKRQKTSHTVEDLTESEPHTPPQPDSIPSILRTGPRARRSESRTSDALLQDATTQAAAVSELANSIENRARSLQPSSARRSASQTTESGEAVAEDTAQPKAQRKKRKSKSRRIQEPAQQVVEDAVNGSTDEPNRRRSRLATPENAEELEIDPQEVSMAELVKDNKIGRKSETEKRMQENWPDIQKRRKEEIEKRREAARGKNRTNEEEHHEAEEAAVPTQIIVDGQIVVANESRTVTFGAGLEEAVNQDASEAREDDRIYKYVTSGSLGKNAGRGRPIRWDEDQTNLFYKGLRMFGTDFSMVANLFPESIDRGVIKKKYLVELRVDPERVEKCVAAKETVSLEDYAAMANQEFEDPETVMKELEEEERRLREEDAKRRADQGFVDHLAGADVPLPTTERDEPYIDESETASQGEPATTDKHSAPPESVGQRTQAPSIGRRERIPVLAQKVIHTAMNPTKKQQRQTKGTAGAGHGGRHAKKGRRAVEGVEERIGPIYEVDR